MYEAVRAAPEGESTVARHAATAAASGFAGIVVRNWTAIEAGGLDSRRAYAEAVEEAYGAELIDATEVEADSPESARGHVGNARSKRTLVCVRGGTPALNRFAVETPQVDVLTAPMRGAGDVNHVLAKAAVENGVRIEFDLGRVLRETGGPRVRALQALRKLRELVEKYDAPFVVSARPRSHLQVRAPRELVAVGETVGFDAESVREGLAEWGRLAARNREIRSESFIGPGVERGRHEEES